MDNVSREDALEKVILELGGPSSPREGEQFFESLTRLRKFAEDGSIEAANLLAEILAFPGPVHHAGDAYKWYYISLSQSGYSVTFEDTGNGTPYYCGPVGDFRNEPLVSELVIELGVEKIHQLDRDAASWLLENIDRW